MRDKLEPYAGRNVLLGIRGYYYGPVWRTLGALDLALGDYERALSRLGLGIARDQALGTAIREVAGRFLYAEAELVRAGAGPRQRAETQLDAAASLIEPMAIAPLAQQLQSLRERCAAFRG